MATTAITSVLNSLERTKLRNAEAVIQRHIGTFVEVGQALAEIRDSRLYRETHKTFEAYISGKWEFKRDYAYKMIGVSGVMNVLQRIQTQPSLLPNLTQAVPLAQLPPEQQPAAWKAAVERAEEAGKPVTAAIVKEVIAEMAAPESSPSSNDGTPDVAASVLLGMNTETIKPTHDQLTKLAALPEKQQNAIMRAVDEGKTLSEAIKAANKPPEKVATPADEAKTQVKIWADTVGRWLSQSPSIDELRAKWPGPKGDAVVAAATTLFEALKNWQKAIK